MTETPSLLTQEHFKITPRGVVICGEPMLDEALAFAGSIIDFYRLTPIAIADLYLFIHTRFGEAEAVSLVPTIGRTKHTIGNWLSIIKQFPIARRVDGLEMGHYDAVIRVKLSNGAPDVGKQDALLAQAAKQSLNIGHLRELAEHEMKSREPKTVDVGDDEEPDDDKPIFDQGDVAAGMDGERREQLDAYGEQNLNDANQCLLTALSGVEKATTAINISMLNRDRVNLSRIKAAIVALQGLLPREFPEPVLNMKSPACSIEIGGPEAPVRNDASSTGQVDEAEIPECLVRDRKNRFPGQTNV